MFPQNSLLFDLESTPIPAGAIAYIGQRAKNSFYDYVMEKFEDSGITKADLARRLKKDPGQLTRMLASPSNWTIETSAELLAAICAEELLPSSMPFAGRPPRNGTQRDIIVKPDKEGLLTRDPGSSSGSSASKIELNLFENVA